MRSKHALVLCAVIMAQMLLAGPGRAASITIPAVPVTDLITVQPIDVCGSSAPSSCAPLTNLASYQQALNAAFNQSGVGFAFLPTVKLIAPSFLDPTITIAPGFPSGTPTDLAHQLMYGANHGQSSNPTTLNVWFVNHLTRTDGIGVYGQGFIGGNGVVIPTLPNPSTGKLPALDTLAHELGHNLGLNHVDGTPSQSAFELLQSVGRTVPTNPCQITPYSCGTPGSATDKLTAAQTAKARNPLFTINLARAVATVITPGDCKPGSPSCNINIAFEDSPTTESLLAFKIRFLNSASVIGGPIITATSPQHLANSGPRTSLIPPTGAAVEYDFAPGVFLNGDSFDVNLAYGSGGVSSSPFSIEFDFSSGATSAALFDGTGFANSQLPESLGFIGTPTYGAGKTVPIVACADVEGDQTTAIVSPCAIDEPPLIPVFLAALLMVGMIIGRTRPRVPV